MAKALLGHVGGPDPRVLTDIRRLRRRVRDLEAEIARMRATASILAASSTAGADRPDDSSRRPAVRAECSDMITDRVQR
jgi:hypothetical protein